MAGIHDEHEFDQLAHMEDNLALFEEVVGPKKMWVFENEYHRASGMPGRYED